MVGVMIQGVTLPGKFGSAFLFVFLKKLHFKKVQYEIVFF